MLAARPSASPDPAGSLPAPARVPGAGAHARWRLVDSALDASTRRVLAEGGDARIALDASGLNAYGCGVRPDPRLVALGSSTSNVISAPAFTAATVLQARLVRAPHRHAAEAERVRRGIAALSGAAQVGGAEVVLAASGTDILLIARQLAEDAAGTPVVAVMAEAGETGSGVPAALAGRHFGADTCGGSAVDKGTPVIAGAAQAPWCVPLRHADGTLRPVEDVDAEFALHVTRVVQGGARCLLVVTDVSKTGLVAPSAACARRLAVQHPGAIEVLVDACQFRLSPASVAVYLRDGFMVALTGSKFVTGPTFCGALLLPPGVARRARGVALHALQPYSLRSHWPASWRAAHALPDAANTGLLLRWEAALTELTAFAAIPTDFSERFLSAWGAAVASRIADDPAFEALPVAALAPHRSAAGWDGLQSIFPFVVLARGQQEAAPRYVDRAETARLHRRLQGLGPAPTSDGGLDDAHSASRFQLGQPVTCGHRGGVAVSALRVCASARGIVEAARQPDGITHAIAMTMRAFDRLAELAGEASARV